MRPNSTHERYNKTCPKCGKTYPTNETVILMKAFAGYKKHLTRLCEECYYDMLDYLGIDDVEV